ncbi:MAG: hypothetical protein IJQ82_14100 [Selenomonadaceae bacterium]|nr:hypothetical protein [Selenomonadaceae bacterium]
MNAEQRKEYYSKEVIRPKPLFGQVPDYVFHCRQCGRLVEVYGINDRRTVFCTRACERKYWRHPERHRSDNFGMSGGMSLSSLIRRERWDLL